MNIDSPMSELPQDDPTLTQNATTAKAFFSSKQGKALIVFIIILGIFGLVTKEVYSRPATDGFVRAIVNVIPFPALSVNGEGVTMKEYLSEYDALISFFDASGETSPSDQELESAITETLMNKLAIRQLAAQYSVEVDENKIEQYYQDVLSAQESEESFLDELNTTFGWDLEEFKERIVRSIVLALQMSSFVSESDELQQERMDLIGSAYARLEAGEDFATVAKDVHAVVDPTLESDLGYMKTSEFSEQWSEPVSLLEVGQYTDILTLSEGYAIFSALDKITAGEDTQMHLQAIMVPKVTLETLVESYLETVPVKNYTE